MESDVRFSFSVDDYDRDRRDRRDRREREPLKEEDKTEQKRTEKDAEKESEAIKVGGNFIFYLVQSNPITRLL